VNSAHWAYVNPFNFADLNIQPTVTINTAVVA